MYYRARRVCCIGGCKNSDERNPGMTFYSLPGRNYEVDRKNRWIEAIKKTREDSWIPTVYSRICSAHFRGGKKSDIERDEAYVPSIFPGLADNGNLPTHQTEVTSGHGVQCIEAHSMMVTPMDVEKSVNTSSVPCQRDRPHSSNEVRGEPNSMFRWTGNNEASPQTNIFVNPKKQPVQPKEQDAFIDQRIRTVNRGCGPDIEMNLGFTGFESISSDESMRQLAGVSQEVFSVFLNLIDRGENRQLAYDRTLKKENRLLLFLMKIKFGLQFTILGAIFGVHERTASSIFFELLETLTEQTKLWIFWPSKESVRKNLPPTFTNYPMCRCIIDCTEIHTDTPPTVEQRVLMSSNYKDGFTVKFLVAITPDGFICKVSKGYGGRATDSFITNDCGFLSLIENGDLVLADKEFPQIKSELSKRNATLVIPPFAFNPRFTADEVDESCKIASVRIHVERAIQRIKISGILNHFTIELLPYVDAIMHMCCVIANTSINKG